MMSVLVGHYRAQVQHTWRTEGRKVLNGVIVSQAENDLLERSQRSFSLYCGLRGSTIVSTEKNRVEIVE